jgi:miniconductance mechanosensitive channel
MTITEFLLHLQQNPLLALGAIVGLSVVLFFLARIIIGRGLTYIADRTESKYDDIIVDSLRPFRVAWLVPLIALYLFAYLLPDYQIYIEKGALFLILWVVALTVNALLNALNQIYESSPTFTGVSIQSYLDLVKLVVLMVAFIISISLVTGQSPLVLLSGLGALMAVLLLVFRDTILSLVASIQIATHDLVREGDWIEVPSYGADGDVINISLHTIKVQNWDKTISVIPTYKMVEVAYKNWRGMQESGGRRIKRSLNIDLGSIRFCDQGMLDRYKEVDLVKGFLEDRLSAEADSVPRGRGVPGESALTNVGVFRAYVEAYLRTHEDLHQEKMTLLVRELAPGPTGLPLEMYVFTKTTNWVEYEAVQAGIIDHLIAAASFFDLRVFQEPTGMDFAAALGGEE